MTPAKLKLRDHLLPEAKKQLDDMIANYEITQQKLVDELANRLEVKIHVLPTDRRLPLIEDPLARLHQPPADWQRPNDCDCPTDPAENMRHQIAKVTQLSRATFPWVHFNRTPLIQKMKPLTPLSKMADFYFDHTNGVGKRYFDELQKNGQLALYVLDDYEGPDKAREPWMRREGSGAADKTFGLTVVMGTPTREPLGSFFFHPHPGKYSYRYASAMVSNDIHPVQPNCRIDLNCKRIVPSIQATTGWDTLNWDPGNQRQRICGNIVPDVFPRIKTSWDSALTPTSAARIDQLKQQDGDAWLNDLKAVLPTGLRSEFVAL